HNAQMKGLMVKGAVRRGPSLIAGLLRCGRCGRRLHVTYSGTKAGAPRVRAGPSHRHARRAAVDRGPWVSLPLRATIPEGNTVGQHALRRPRTTERPEQRPDPRRERP